MNIIESTENLLNSGTSVADGLMISSIKKFSPEKHKILHFVIEYPKISHDKVNSPFALQGWLLGELQIQAIEVSQSGVVVASILIDVHRPDVAKHFNLDDGYDRYGFFSHLNPYLLPEQFELEVNAITEGAEKILLCTISGQRPSLPSCDLPPLLVTTLGRTGSTALLGTLGMHPKVAVYKPFDQEARYISYYTQMFRTMSSAYSWQVPLAAISENVSQDQLIGRGVPSDDILHYSVYSEMWDSFYHQYAPDLFKFCAGQLSQLYRQVAKLNGNDSPQWIVEKFVPGNEVTEVKTLFPSAREIVLVRDPRDVYCSILSFIEKKGQLGFGRECFQNNRSYLMEGFIPSVMQLYRYWKAHVDSVCLVRYEDMILEPQRTFHRICQHLGIDTTFETINQMLVKASETSKNRQTEHQTSSSVANSIGRFRNVLPQSDVSLINNLLCEPLTEFGYELRVADKDTLFQVVPKELRHAHSTQFAKNGSIEVQAEGIQLPNSVVTDKKSAFKTVMEELQCAEELQRVYDTLLAKDDAIAIQAEEIHRLNSVVLAKDDAIAIQAEEIHQLYSALSGKESRHASCDQSPAERIIRKC